MLSRLLCLCACATIVIHAEHGPNEFGNSSVDLFSNVNSVRTVVQEYAREIIGKYERTSSEYMEAQDRYRVLKSQYDDFVETLVTGLSSGRGASTAILVANNTQRAVVDFVAVASKLLPTLGSANTLGRTIPLVFTTAQLFEINKRERSFQTLVQMFRTQGKLAAWGATE